jgi:hypothetical protein
MRRGVNTLPRPSLGEGSEPPATVIPAWIISKFFIDFSARKRLFLASFCATLLAVLFFFDPSETAIFPPCLIRLYTGWSCPGCGATRALHALLHLRLEEAWRYNKLWTAAAPVLAAWGVWRLWTGTGRRSEA